MATRIWSKSIVWKNFVKTSFNNECSNKQIYAPVSSSTLGLSRDFCSTNLLPKFGTQKNTPPIFFQNVSLKSGLLKSATAFSTVSASIAEDKFACGSALKSDKHAYHRLQSYSTNSDSMENKPEKKSNQILQSMFEKSKAESEQNSGPNQQNKEKTNEKKEKEETESAFLKNQRYAKWFLLGSVVIVTPIFILRNGKLEHFSRMCNYCNLF